MILLPPVAVLLLSLGLGQLISTWQGWRAASLVGANRLAGYGLGILLLTAGAKLLPPDGSVLGWTLLAGPLALGLLLLAGSYIMPPSHPDGLFAPDHPAHGGCCRVQIPDGDFLMPGLLLKPQPGILPSPFTGGVLVIHGAGDTKTSFKWRLIRALLAEGLTVLTVDLPGHGDYRHRPLAYPDCLSAIPAAIQFLRGQPGIERVGLVGVSLGSVMALRSLAETSPWENASFGTPPDKIRVTPKIDALAALGTPLHLKYSRMLFYRELWNACRAPVLSLLQEVTVKQMRQSWYTGGYISRHKNTAEVISLLNPLEGITHLKDTPILLVHGGRDTVAPLKAGRLLRQTTPMAALLEIKPASHVTLVLMPEVNRQVACWLKERLINER